MTISANAIGAILVAYLIGSLSFAVIVSWAMGMPDPHTYGSGNPGATNVLRSGKKLAALLTLIGDAGKGWFAVWFAKIFAGEFDLSDATIAAVAVAVFLGHLFPVFFRFLGGKGVATAAGILIAIDLRMGFSVLATWLVIAWVFRYSSLAAIIATLASPLFCHYFLGASAFLPAVIFMSVMLVWRHKENIRKLLNGTESRIGEKKKTDQVAEPIPPPPTAS